MKKPKTKKTFLGFVKVKRETVGRLLFTKSEVDAARRRWEKRQFKKRLKKVTKK